MIFDTSRKSSGIEHEKVSESRGRVKQTCERAKRSGGRTDGLPIATINQGKLDRRGAAVTASVA